MRHRNLDLPPDMTEQEFHELARYNGETMRGLVHTDEWKTKMTNLQARWDRWALERQAEANHQLASDQRGG